MSEDARNRFEASLIQLNAIEADDYQSLKELRDTWKSIFNDDPELLTYAYSVYFDKIRSLLNSKSPRALSDQLDAYKFISTFSSSSFLYARKARSNAHRLLADYHEEHLALIKEALTRPDDKITEKHLKTDTGKWGDIPCAMLELYSWHTDYLSDSSRLEADAAELIPAFCRKFPDQDSFLLASLLMSHPHAVSEAISLIRFNLLDRGNPKEGLASSLISDMLGYYSDNSKAAHKNCAHILAGVLKGCEEWPETAINSFVKNIIRNPLGIEIFPQNEAIADQRDIVKNYERVLSENRYEKSRDREWDEEHLASAKAELAFIETDFDGWNAKRRRRAVQRIAVSGATRKGLQAVVKAMPAKYRQPMQDLLDEAIDYANRPKRFPMPKPKDNRFKDLGLKLLVIEELMYRQKVLEPRFDIREFAQEYEKREISVEADGYEIIPEVERYFRNLAISDDLLARVEVLHQSSGLDGGSEFIYHLYPFWDPGAGDEPVTVTAKAEKDLPLLPNLKRISGLENSNPSAKLKKAFAQRGIELVTEEQK